MPEQITTITLGRHKNIPVVPQKHARLRRLLTKEMLGRLMSADYSKEAYRTLCVLIPAIDPSTPLNQQNGAGIPLWEFEGYGSQEAMEQDAWTDEDDNSPTTAEIVNAFETALMVAGAGRLGKIIGLVESMGDLSKLQTQTPTVPSPVSPGSSGE